jgi:RNA polymerase sigma factor (sigma-70 family)
MGRDDRGDCRARRDARRFDVLFREHAASIYRYCLHRTGDWALAEDLCSAVFFEAWRRRQEVDLETRAARPWLYGVAVNVLRNQRRSVRRREAAIRRLPLPVPSFDMPDDVVERLDASARGRLAHALLEQLPAGERDVIALCVEQNLTYRAAAKTLGLPVGTVRSRLSRARARLSALALERQAPPECGAAARLSPRRTEERGRT